MRGGKTHIKWFSSLCPNPAAPWSVGVKWWYDGQIVISAPTSVKKSCNMYFSLVTERDRISLHLHVCEWWCVCVWVGGRAVACSYSSHVWVTLQSRLFITRSLPLPLPTFSFLKNIIVIGSSSQSTQWDGFYFQNFIMIIAVYVCTLVMRRPNQTCGHP